MMVSRGGSALIGFFKIKFCIDYGRVLNVLGPM